MPQARRCRCTSWAIVLMAIAVLATTMYVNYGRLIGWHEHTTPTKCHPITMQIINWDEYLILFLIIKPKNTINWLKCAKKYHKSTTNWLKSAITHLKYANLNVFLTEKAYSFSLFVEEQQYLFWCSSIQCSYSVPLYKMSSHAFLNDLVIKWHVLLNDFSTSLGCNE